MKTKMQKNNVLDQTLQSSNLRDQKWFLPKPKEQICGKGTDT